MTGRGTADGGRDPGGPGGGGRAESWITGPSARRYPGPAAAALPGPSAPSAQPDPSVPPPEPGPPQPVSLTPGPPVPSTAPVPSLASPPPVTPPGPPAPLVTGRRPGRRRRTRALVELVRAPAALTVPGDVLTGAAAAGRPLGPAVLGTAASSVCLYWAGMALNDYADRYLDAVERPERPIPSGALSARTALGAACALTLAGLGAAAAVNGRRGLATAVPLAAAVWGYDLAGKPTPAGPAVMAAARALDVLAGAGPAGAVRAFPAAAAIGLHTAATTRLSRHETEPGPAVPRALPPAVLAVSGALGAAAVRRARGRDRARGVRRVSFATSVAVPSALLYTAGCVRAQLAVLEDPSAANVRRAVAAGIHALLPLQAALTAAAGRPGPALPLAAAYPLVRRLGRKVTPT